MSNAFRVGKDGNNAPVPAATQTLPQPVFPGINNAFASAGEALDPNFRPSMSHQYDLTVQRQINAKTTVEFGYIGRHYTHDLHAININAVPYMMTLGGQRFSTPSGVRATSWVNEFSDT